MKTDKFLIRGFFALTFIFYILPFSFSQTSIQTFQTLSGLSIRALFAVNDQEAWFAANRGVWGYTLDAGNTWHIDSIKVDTIVPEFRGISVLNDSTVLLMGIASPGFIFKTTNKGKNWKIVYRNDNPKIFMDCIHFKDSKNGLVVGDPMNETVQLMRTKDAGETWRNISEDSIPVLYPGMSIFASSNTNLEWKNDRIWFCTGGSNANIWLNEKNAYTFDRYETPIAEGEIMDGIYSMDFWDSKLGVIAGGNYDRADTTIVILSITADGGKNWEELEVDQPMFGSCVQFLNRNEFFVTGKPGTFLYNIKKKKIIYLKDGKGNDIGFHTLRISPSKKTVWLAGADGKIGRLDLKKK